MTQPSGSTEPSWEKYLKYAISAFVSVTHVIAFFQIVICSRHLAVAFNIPPKNIGIYFPKLYSLRSVLMSMACGIEYGIFRSTGSKDVRKYLSMVWFVLLTICEVSFLCVLYSSKSVAFHNYIVLNLEGMFFGFFQMSILSLIPEFAAYYMLSLYVSGTSIFIIQTIIDRFTKNSMLSVKIQAWVCVICSVLCVPLWIYYLIKLFKDPTKNTDTSGAGSQATNSTSSTCGSNSTNKRSAVGFYEHPSVLGHESSVLKMKYLMTINSMSILKLITDQLDDLCLQLNSEAVMSARILIARLQQITHEREITDQVLVAIDLVILSLKSSCPPGLLLLLQELSLLLRIKVQVKIDQNQITEGSYGRGHSGFNGLVVSPTNHPLYSYPGTGHPYDYLENDDTKTEKRIIPETPPRSRRRRRNTQETQTSKGLHEHLLPSLSQLLMFPIGSLVKDFLFPGVIPYGLLERDKCHLINLIVIIFLSVGPVVIFVMALSIGEKFKCDNTWIHLFWSCMIPKIIILIISLCAIHTKQSCTHKIRSSQPIVLFMTVVVLTCYGFLETMSFVGMAHYVKFISGDFSGTVDLQAIHNVFGKFFRYFVYKFSVGYNKTRISSGFTLPNFKPPEPIGDTFCYWFKGTFSNGWKDFKSDFKMNIKQYLAAGPTPSKKSPIETLRYCDIFM